MLSYDGEAVFYFYGVRISSHDASWLACAGSCFYGYSAVYACYQMASTTIMDREDIALLGPRGGLVVVEPESHVEKLNLLAVSVARGSGINVNSKPSFFSASMSLGNKVFLPVSRAMGSAKGPVAYKAEFP